MAINTSSGVRLSPAVVFEGRTVNALVNCLSNPSSPAGRWCWLALMQGGTQWPPIYCIHGNIWPVARFVPPDEFEELSRFGTELEFFNVASARLVCSSYHADRQAKEIV